MISACFGRAERMYQMELMAFGLLMKSVADPAGVGSAGLLRIEDPILEVGWREPALEHLAFAHVLVADGGRQILPLRIIRIGGRLGGIERNMANAAGEAGQVRRLHARIEIEELVGVPHRRIEVRVGEDADSHDAARIGIGAVVQIQAEGVGLRGGFASGIVDHSQLRETLRPRRAGDISQRSAHPREGRKAA
jgi:hypothetical protein